MKAAVIDTSVLISAEIGRDVDRELLPDEAFVSVVTIAELHAGVLVAPDSRIQSQRMATLAEVSRVAALPIDAEVARAWALLRVELARAGRRANVNDLWIAATAVANHLPVVTQDGDFDVLAELDLVTVIKV